MNRTTRRARWIAPAALVSFVVLQGCAAIPIAAVGASALEAGTGVVVKTGTEYTMGGTAYRTFTIPLDDVRGAVLQAFHRTGVEVTKDETGNGRVRIVGKAGPHTVRARLRALTPTLTTMALVVKRDIFARDRATTSELLEQTEQVLAEYPPFARRLRRERNGAGYASPRD